MVDFALTLGLVLIVGTLAGHGIHWWLHQPRAGSLYRSHLEHHRLYPPGDLRGAAYRSAGADTSTWRFVMPLAGLVALFAQGMIWLGMGGPEVLALVVAAAGVGFAHDFVHDAFHVEGHWLERSPMFLRLRALHDLHHGDVRANLGILFLGWDRLLGSFRRAP